MPTSDRTSDRTSDTVDFVTHTVTCSGDVYWDWQVGNRAHGGSGSCEDWAVAMGLDKDGPTVEQQELLGLSPDDTYYETSGEAQWQGLIQAGVIDADGNYLDGYGNPTGSTVYDESGCDPATTDCD